MKKPLSLPFHFIFVTKESVISAAAKMIILPAGIDLDLFHMVFISQLIKATPFSVRTMAGYSETVLMQLQSELDVCCPSCGALVLQVM